jgi:hypothetical protein
MTRTSGYGSLHWGKTLASLTLGPAKVKQVCCTSRSGELVSHVHRRITSFAHSFVSSMCGSL